MNCSGFDQQCTATSKTKPWVGVNVRGAIEPSQTVNTKKIKSTAIDAPVSLLDILVNLPENSVLTENPLMNEFESLELLLATHQFPGPYMFKVIGRDQNGFVARVLLCIRQALQIEQDPPFRTQPSSNGKHVSVTLEPHVFRPEEVITVYQHLRQTEGVLMVM